MQNYNFVCSLYGCDIWSVAVRGVLKFAAPQLSTRRVNINPRYMNGNINIIAVFINIVTTNEDQWILRRINVYCNIIWELWSYACMEFEGK
jgi:hypothetical protein